MRRGGLLVALAVLLLVAMTTATDSAVLDAGVLAGAGIVVAGGLAVIAFLRGRQR